MGEEEATRLDEARLRSECLAAADTLAAYLSGSEPTHDPTGRTSGRIDDFSERFMAWAWVARTIRDDHCLDGSLSDLAFKAVERSVNDPEMVDHLRQCQAIFDSQKAGLPDQIDVRLQAMDGWAAQTAAMGIVVQTALYVLRQAAGSGQWSTSAVIADLRSRIL